MRSDQLRRVAGTTLVSAVAMVGAFGAPADAVSSQGGGARVVDIEHRVVGIVRRVESISGAVSTQESPDTVQVTLAADVFFDFDSADISPSAGARITDVAQQITTLAGGPVAVVGYTDAKGTDAYNADLSLRRATSVRDALSPLTARATFTVEGKGAADPVAPNQNDDGSDNPAGRARNRRVTITFDRKA